MKLTVIICTYNPSPETFNTCILYVKQALANYPATEVIIIDNNSSTPVSKMDFVQQGMDGNWSIVVEEEQGLTAARLRGIKEAKGDLLVYIDDDNFIQEDFLRKGIEIALQHPFIGAFSGQVKLKFEQEPEPWTKRYWGLLVHREFENDRWSNLPHLDETMPCGAGLFVRKDVAIHYLRLHENGQRAIQLDRKGKSLFSGGDNDLAACACDVGYGVGLFCSLVLTHYIPANRTTKEYLLRLAKGIAASSVVFKSFRNEYPLPVSTKTRIANSVRLLAMDKTSREFYRAVLDGEQEGRIMLGEPSAKS
jgi:glycosyltransferase involved in cell wall biosynthesis